MIKKDNCVSIIKTQINVELMRQCVRKVEMFMVILFITLIICL